MPSHHAHKQTPSLSQTQNHKAQLANAYNELGKELSSAKLRVVGNYTLGRVIGEGAYGKVRIGTHRLTSTRVAIKQIPKAMSASLTREIHHHRQLHHPHITQMYEVIATESHIWIVSELCCGGELFDYLVEKGRLSEDEARVIFGQLCLAVDYLHSNNIVHRDLKLENVLLDERCRVKLGDFGFTREFERGTLMETFCGTTGYASPEMLQAKKYQGPEVDVWSLGIILYCLLTGTLPFDDDDEDVMRSKIIKGEFEDPIWLSLESRDLMKNILVKDVATRFTIPQILSHPWFTSRKLAYEPDSPVSTMPLFSASSVDNRPATPPPSAPAMEDDSRRSSQGTAPDSSQASTQDSFSPFIKHQPEIISSTPTTPDESTMHDPFESTENIQSTSTSYNNNNNNNNFEPSIHRLPSTSTIRKMSASDLESVSSRLARTTNDKQVSSATPTVIEEENDNDDDDDMPPRRHTPSPLIFTTSGKTPAPPPPSHPMRTPARTKRRSVSSILSAESASPTAEKTPTPLALPASRDLDFQTMLSARTPVIFSTPTERHLLSTLALLGFDTAQIVHSVLSNACDASGALWWILQKKDEVKAGLELQLQQQQQQQGAVGNPVLGGGAKALVASPTDDADESTHERAASIGDSSRPKTPKKKRNKVSAGSQTEAIYTDDQHQTVDFPSHPTNYYQQRSIGPKFAIVPPTPTLASSGRPTTPPRAVSPTPRSHNNGMNSNNNASNPLLSPSSSTIAGELSVRSYPSTPSGSMKESGGRSGKSGDGGGRKARSGSVSIMQRATTALEAAGLVRKKSSEAFREEKEREREREKERERERSRDADREKEKEKRTHSGDEPRSSHGSGGSSKLTKSPPLKATKEKEKEKENAQQQQPPSTPPPTEANALPALIGSPWFLAEGKEALAQTHSHSQPGTVSHMPTAGEMIHSHSTPNFSDVRPTSPSSPHSNSNANVNANSSSNSNANANAAKTTTSAGTGARNINQSKPVGASAGRNRANLLTAFRLWFNEDRKGKRKEAADNNTASGSGLPTLNAHHRSGTVGGGRRGSTSKANSGGSAGGGAGKFGGTAASRTTPRPQRPSMSSRRSSSVNSRRSSVGTAASVHMLVLDSPQIPTRPSFGSHTPNSERGEHSSRPSSIRSVSMQPRHRKSPSQSSAGSIHLRTASPMQKYHRRAGSGSSTRVVRQMGSVGGVRGGLHKRSNSAASSVHSPSSSRPTSWYEPSESEGPGQKRTASPYKSRTNRRSLDEGSGSGSARKSTGGSGSGSATTTTTFVAQKRQGPFQSPSTSGSGGMITRSSWKKSWGIEPPGWSSRTAHLPIEVLAISPATEPTSIRDVFSGKAVYTSLGAGGGGDESDWVDEDDDIPVFVGGLGQVGMTLHHATGSGGGAGGMFNAHQMLEHKPITLSPAPRGHRSTAKRAGRNGGGGGSGGGGNSNNSGGGSCGSGGGSGSGGLSAGGSGGGGRQKAGGHSPAERSSPLPPDTGYDSSESRPGRRQLPATRPGPAFKHPIQEEDEGEEE